MTVLPCVEILPQFLKIIALDLRWTMLKMKQAMVCMHVRRMKLPQWLPSQKDKRHERNIVTLRDPSDRLWPVTYHESIKFIGFANGWKDFTIANNIQRGNLCSIL